MNYYGAKGVEIGIDSPNVDPAVTKALPPNSRVISTRKHGNSFWADTGRIDVLLNDKKECSYFIKVVSGETGKNMVASEYQSAKTIYEQAPEFIPQVIAIGTYESVESTHFILIEFVDMIITLPEPDIFTGRLASLHKNSISPTGKFGYDKQSYIGILPQHIGWEDSWEAFFTKCIRQSLDVYINANGHDPEMYDLIHSLFTKVIPRLLRPLESEGRKVKPSLIHGDLWFANVSRDTKTGQPLIFDACCIYAHNEFEFGQWTTPGNPFGQEYISAYHKHYPPSEPVIDFGGRVDLYRLRFNSHVSALFPDDTRLRNDVLDGLKDLTARYGS